MTTLRSILLAGLIGLSMGGALAQPGGGMGPGSGPGGPRGNAANMPGAAMMTAEERNAHRDRMRAMTNHDECKAYQAQHHEQMVARAKERGIKPPALPRRDPCAGLKK